MMSAGFVHWKVRFCWVKCSMYASNFVARSSFDGSRPRRMTFACTRLNNTSTGFSHDEYVGRNRVDDVEGDS